MRREEGVRGRVEGGAAADMAWGDGTGGGRIDYGRGEARPGNAREGVGQRIGFACGCDDQTVCRSRARAAWRTRCRRSRSAGSGAHRREGEGGGV